MRLLFDQNISYRILPKLEHHFPDSTQVREVALQNATDQEIWEYAKKHKFIIVTFDSDFYDFSLVLGSPPKVIVIRSYNQTTNFIVDLIIKNKDNILAFSADQQLNCLEISPN